MLNRPIAQVDRLSYIDPHGHRLGYSAPMSQGTPWYRVATRLRKDQRITLQDLADRLGYAKSTVGHWLTGHNPAPLAIIKEIAMILGTTEIALIADDPFYITDTAERRIVERLRKLSEDRRELAIKVVENALAGFDANDNQNHPA